MNRLEPFVDIHCHILPALDDGPAGWDEALAMAEIAVTDGITAIVATPHQLGNYLQNTPEIIRERVIQFQQRLDRHGICLQVFPGADVRLEPDLVGKIQKGEVLTLADRRRHVLLELPHEVYISLDRVLEELHSVGLIGILSHPERNRGIINQPDVIRKLIKQGCLMQVTAGSLLGMFGTRIKKFTGWMVEQGLVHLIATDAHGIKSRRPVLSHAFDRLTELSGLDVAIEVCCRNPARVAAGMPIYQHHKSNEKNHISFVSSHFY